MIFCCHANPPAFILFLTVPPADPPPVQRRRFPQGAYKDSAPFSDWAAMRGPPFSRNCSFSASSSSFWIDPLGPFPSFFRMPMWNPGVQLAQLFWPTDPVLATAMYMPICWTYGLFLRDTSLGPLVSLLSDMGPYVQNGGLLPRPRFGSQRVQPGRFSPPFPSIQSSIRLGTRSDRPLFPRQNFDHCHPFPHFIHSDCRLVFLAPASNPFFLFLYYRRFVRANCLRIPLTVSI